MKIDKINYEDIEIVDRTIDFFMEQNVGFMKNNYQIIADSLVDLVETKKPKALSAFKLSIKRQNCNCKKKESEVIVTFQKTIYFLGFIPTKLVLIEKKYKY